MITINTLIGLALLFGASDPNIRDQVSLDIYNRDQALVREIRHVDLVEGRNVIDFHNIADGLYSHSVFIRPVEKDKHIKLVSLSHHYHLFHPDFFYKHWLGKWMSFSIEQDTYQGRLIYYDEYDLYVQPDTTREDVIIYERSEITYFPLMPPGTVVAPTIRWTVDSKKALEAVPVELSYLTSDIIWSCNYRGELVDDSVLKLTGYFTIDNGSLLPFTNARVALVAGETHRARDQQEGQEKSSPGIGGEAKGAERLFEYYRYPIEQPVDLMGDMKVQIPFFDEKEIQYTKRFEVPHLLGGDQVRTKLLFSVDEKKLGVPLPEGQIGLYRRTEDKQLGFIGEDQIPVTPVGGQVKIDVGAAFDLQARRTRMAQIRPERNKHEETWRVEISNSRKEDATVYVEQRVFGYYEVLRAEANGLTAKYEEQEANVLVFEVNTQAGKRTVLEFVLSYGY